MNKMGGGEFKFIGYFTKIFGRILFSSKIGELWRNVVFHCDQEIEELTSSLDRSIVSKNENAVT